MSCSSDERDSSSSAWTSISPKDLGSRDGGSSFSGSGSEAGTTEAHGSESSLSDINDDHNDQESADRYTKGGYHPLRIADIIDDRYHIVRKIGHGHFSTVWLTWDSTTPPHDPVFKALKVSKADATFATAVRTEIEILDRINNSDADHPFRQFVCAILDHFVVDSPNGNHVCMVTHCHGEDLLRLLKRGDHKGLPEANVKLIVKQMLQGLSYLHDACGIIHTDIKPENVLIEVSPHHLRKIAMDAVHRHKSGEIMPPDYVGSHELTAAATSSTTSTSTAVDADAGNKKKKQRVNPWKFTDDMINKTLTSDHKDPDPALDVCPGLRVKIADFGNACYVDHHFTETIQTLPYRSPEVIIGAGFDTTADVWSTACVAFEITTGDYLFDGLVDGRWATQEDHLSHIVELMGNFPRHVIREGKFGRKFFTTGGYLRKHHPKKFWFLQDVLIEKYSWGKTKALNFAAFLLPMLSLDKESRIGADEASRLPFLNDDNNNQQQQ